MKKIEEQVMLVNTEDEDVKLFPKLAAHEQGLLHRAYSVFVFNLKDELLLQRRAISKYHSPGLWTNTCCSHPLLKQNIVIEAEKRLMEEMGFTCKLTFGFKFIYKAEFGNLTEHELDYVLIGNYDKAPVINPAEVMAYKYLSLANIKKEIIESPESYTEWFKICFKTLEEHYRKIKE